MASQSYVFVGKDGSPVHPAYVDGWFRVFVRCAAVLGLFR